MHHAQVFIRLNTWLSLGLLLIALMAFTQTARANDQALAWLSEQFQSDGSSGRPGDVATSIQSTAETLRTLQVLDPARANASPASLTFLAASTQPPNTEYLARAVIANAEAKASNTGLLSALEANQNPDGGFGGASGFSSNVLDTAFAIEALAKAHSRNFTAVSQAISYLLHHQNLDGSYSLDDLTTGSPYPTAAALIALQQYRLSFNLADSIAGAVHSLIAFQTVSGGWSSDWETALALLALEPATTDVTPFFLGIQALEAAQLSDGSWGQDVYSTALAARAMRAVRGSPTPSPWNASLTGRVVDSGSGLPLGGVQVTVGTALSATTDPTGMFRLNEISPGSYFITCTIPGYADANQTVSLTAGQQVGLGTIRLTALPTTGIVTGIVTDSGSGQPVAGAQVTLTGTDNVSAVTDTAGSYRFVAPPGPATITASAAGFLDATGSATLEAGQTLNFSPGLQATAGLPPDYQPPTTIVLTGAVVDALTGQSLAGASVSVTGSALQASTDPAGLFRLADLPPGELALDVALAGYQGVHVSLIAPAGTADLGTIRLPPAANLELTTSIAGTVTDSGTGAPLAGASVTIEGLGKGALTGADGSYRIEGITQNTFTVTVSAVGYLSGRGDVTLAQPGLMPLNVALNRASPADFDIVELMAEASSYPAYSEVKVEAQLVNRAAIERQVRLYAVIVGDEGLVVDQFPAKVVPMGGDPATALETVPAGGAQAAEVEWYNGARAPGRYDVIVQAYDAASGQLLAERSTPVEILATRAIGGSVTFDPPITQLASRQPVHLTAKVTNRGNLDLAGGMATAKITLKNPSGHTNSVVEVETWVQNNGLSSPQGMDRDSGGNIYVVNYNAGTLSRIDDQTGTVTEVARGFINPMDVDVAPNGDIYVLNYLNSYVRLAKGVRETVATNIASGQQAIEVLADGRILIAAASYGVYEITTGNKTKLPLTGLQFANEIQADAQGAVYIGDYLGNKIFRLVAGNVLETVQTNLRNLVTFAIGPDGTLAVIYKAIDNTNQLALMSPPDGARREMNITLPPGIQGVVWDAEGRVLLSDYNPNYNVNAILRLPSAPSSEAAIGEVTYTRTVPLPPLGLADSAVALDFGSWTPTASGDFQVELSVDTHPEFGALYNTLHVGPNAHGIMAVAQPTVRPGDQANQATVTLFGADFTSITRIDPNGTPLTATTKLYALASQPQGVAADTQGNVYATDNSRIVRVTPKDGVSTFVSGYSFGAGLAIDSQDNLYTYVTNDVRTVLKITQNTTGMPPTITPLATLGGGIKGLAVGYDDRLYVVDTHNVLSRIYPADGRVEQVVNQIGISSPMGLTIDANGYFYIPTQISVKHQDEDGKTRNYYKILRISPDGKRYSDHYTQAYFEFEGANVTADCSNNLLFAPWMDYPFKLTIAAEENTLLQLIGDTGEVRQVLYGPSIDPELADMDVLFYDRFGKRLLIWTDQKGKIFSFPVICGGIDADVHLVTRSDVDVSQMTREPTQSIDRGDGTFEHIWALKDVDNRGLSLQLDLWMKGLTEGETRPIAQEAFIEFHNSFVPGQRVRTPLAIPEVKASTGMTLQPSLDAAQYGPLSAVGITVAVKNDGDQPFTGELQLSVVDAAGALVQELPPMAVTEQPGHLTVPYPATWNTGLFLAGGYQLKASLLDVDGRVVASGSTAFTIVYGLAASTLDATLSPDQLIYAGWDAVRLDGAVTNTASNTLLDLSVMTVTVRDPYNAVLYTGQAEIGQLAPGGALPVGFGFPLADAPSGRYTVEVRVTRALNGMLLDSFQKTFSVVHTALQGLAGTLTATPGQVTMGTPVDCLETVTNRSASSVEALSLSSVLVSQDRAAVIATDSRTLSLAGGQTETRTRRVDTTTLPPGDYACLLRATLDGAVKDVASATFKVLVPPITLSGTVFHDVNHDQARNGIEPGTSAGGVWVTAVANGTAVATAAVQPDGTYRLMVPGQAAYTLVLSTAANGTAARLPFGWSPTGETRGGTPDGVSDGQLPMAVGLQDLTDLDFGLDGLPALASNDNATTPRNVAVTLPILANDRLGIGTTRFITSTIDLDPATPEVEATVTVPGEGTFAVQPAGTVVFTPLPTFSGVSTVTYGVYDDLGQPTNPANLTVTVAGPGNPSGDTAADRPRANPEAGTTSLDTPTTLDVTINDVASPGAILDPATVDLDPATPAVDEDRITAEGAWHSNGDGLVTFTPASAYTGPATRPYAITDSTSKTAQSTLTVMVTGGDVPIALNDSGATWPLTPVTLAVLDNDAASAGHSLVAGTLDLNPATPAVEPSLDTTEGHWVVNAEGTITFTPMGDTGTGQPFTGTTAPRPYAVTDSAGRTAAATLTVVVNPTQVPTAMDDSANTPFNTSVTLAPAANDTAEPGAVLDPTTLDLDPDTLTVEQVRTPPEGIWQVHPDGTLTFTPQTDSVGTPQMSYLIRDSLGHAATARVTVTVAPPESVTLRGTVFHDLDHNQVQNGTEPGTNAGRLSVTVVDGTGQAVATAPVDADGGYQLAIPPLADYDLVLSMAAEGLVASLPAGWNTAGENRAGVPDAAADGRLNLHVGVVAVDGLNFGIDGAPSVANDDRAATPYATPITLAPLANDTPGPGTTRLDPATLDLDPTTPAVDTRVVVADQGTYQAAGDGTVTFTPEPAFSGVSTLAYQVQDDLAQFTNTAMLIVAVGPSAADDTLTAAYETPASGSLAGNDHAPNAAVFAQIGGPSHGTATVAEDGRYTYTPAAGYSGPDTFTYRVCLPAPDDTLCASATVTVMVAPPPIRVRGHLEPGPRGRLLVLVDPRPADCNESEDRDANQRSAKKQGDQNNADEDGDANHSPTEQQGSDRDTEVEDEDERCSTTPAERAYLDAVLKTGGWTYTRVETASDFAREFHSGAYRLYAVLSAQVKLPEQIQKELREAVYHGTGLLVGGDHDQRNNVLDTALGLQYVGQSTAASGLQVPTAAGYAGVDRRLTTVDRVLRVRPLSATVLGQFVDLDRKALGPAVTHQGYGHGKAAYLAFDLLAEGAATEPVGAGEFSQLLLNLLDDLAPAPEYRPGEVMPIRLSLHNAGIAVEGWIDLALGGGATVYDAGSAVRQADGRLRWKYALAVDGALERLAWARLPATGTATADARVFVAGHADPYAMLALTWPITEVPALETAQNRLEALAAADKSYQSARQGVQRAAQALATGDLDRARAELVRTAEALIRIGTAEAAEVRQAVDEALRRVGLPG
jgi:CshA-type fibril repeat protein